MSHEHGDGGLYSEDFYSQEQDRPCASMHSFAHYIVDSFCLLISATLMSQEWQQ